LFDVLPPFETTVATTTTGWFSDFLTINNNNKNNRNLSNKSANNNLFDKFPPFELVLPSNYLKTTAATTTTCCSSDFLTINNNNNNNNNNIENNNNNNATTNEKSIKNFGLDNLCNICRHECILYLNKLKEKCLNNHRGVSYIFPIQEKSEFTNEIEVNSTTERNTRRESDPRKKFVNLPKGVHFLSVANSKSRFFIPSTKNYFGPIKLSKIHCDSGCASMLLQIESLDILHEIQVFFYYYYYFIIIIFFLIL
jgi:hypothetical protein